VNHGENNKRIAKNTLFLYFRMLLSMGVSLYTSRVVLNTLGIEDYGVANVAGGVIVMFSFLNSSMSGATSRFLTFELGCGNYEKLKKTFSAALTVHFIIAGIILILGETIGLWFLENKLVIAPERMNAARWVYQLSILSTMISITQAPYSATIIAHERMNIYAYMEILNSFLKLGIVYLLVISSFDKLIFFAALNLCVTVMIITIYRIYCLKNFPESHYKYEWNKEIMKPMLSFSGWDLLGSLSYLSKTQGINILLNLFFGVVVNAAYGIATQVQSAVSQFSGNFLAAVRPQIVKYYAANEIDKMQHLMFNASKLSFFLIFLISFPLIIENHFILQLWLKQVPEYAVPFCRLILLSFWISAIFLPVQFVIHATGKIKRMTTTISTIYILTLPVSYVVFKLGFSPVSSFVINLIITFFGCQVYIWALNKNIPQISIFNFYKKVVLICIVVGLLSSIVPFYIHYSMNEGWGRLIYVIISSGIVSLFAGYFLILSENMRRKGLNLVMQKLKDWK
jgi:O-antigen/teichoic acid export membrane protein